MNSNVIPFAPLLAAAAEPEVLNPAPSLERGMSGTLVAELQRKLKEWGFDPGTTSGNFDEDTENAVRALQRKLGVSPSGFVDKPTREAMAKDLASTASVLRPSNSLVPSGGVSTSAVPGAAASSAQPFYKQPVFLLAAGGALLWFLNRNKAASYDDIGVEDLEEDDVQLEEPKPKRKRKKRKAKAKAKELSAPPDDMPDDPPAEEETP